MPSRGLAVGHSYTPRRGLVVLLSYLILDFRVGAGPLPVKDLLVILQCAIAARDVLDRGLEGAVRVCFVQD